MGDSDRKPIHNPDLPGELRGLMGEWRNHVDHQPLWDALSGPMEVLAIESYKLGLKEGKRRLIESAVNLISSL